MARFKPSYRKTAADGSSITVYRSSGGEWFVGRPGDELAYHPTPLGAFCSATAACRFADRRFPGGAWSRARGRAGLPAGLRAQEA